MLSEFDTNSIEALPALELSLMDLRGLKTGPPDDSNVKPRILLLCGSMKVRSFSKLLTTEAARLLQHIGAKTMIFDLSGLSLPDGVPVDHPQVLELRNLVMCQTVIVVSYRTGDTSLMLSECLRVLEGK